MLINKDSQTWLLIGWQLCAAGQSETMLKNDKPLAVILTEYPFANPSSAYEVKINMNQKGKKTRRI